MQHCPVGHYGDASDRSTHWSVDGVIKNHQTVSTYVNTLLDSGFRLLHLGEPAPTKDILAQ